MTHAGFAVRCRNYLKRKTASYAGHGCAKCGKISWLIFQENALKISVDLSFRGGVQTPLRDDRREDRRRGRIEEVEPLETKKCAQNTVILW